jgi:hypothetical protein
VTQTQYTTPQGEIVKRSIKTLLVAGAVPAMALPLGLGVMGSASAATLTPNDHGHNQCDETLTYIQLGRDGGFVRVNDVCNVQVFFTGHRRHHEEDLSYQTQERRHLEDHFAENVANVHVRTGHDH